MIDVAVIGSGVMGSAFVRVLLRAKYSVTVWISHIDIRL